MTRDVVLVTRPEPDASTECALLAERGVEALAAPLTAIVPVEPRPDVPAEAEAVVFTSAHAVAAMTGSEAARLPAHAVGRRTGDAAAAAGFSVVEPADYGSGDVAALARRLIAAPERRFLHPTGRQVAGDLSAMLATAGKTVERVVVYEAVERPFADEPLAALAQNRVRAIGFWSPRNAELFAARAAEAGWSLDGTTAVAISAAAAAPLAASGFARIDRAARPDGDAMRRALCEAVGHG
ncbi:MAG: uroporphyrinogen-III synthase [Pseudomonadota bacterium]